MTQMTDLARLTVELSPEVAAMLDTLARDEDLNKTTIVNRAIQVYFAIQQIDARGEELYLMRPGSKRLNLLKFVE
jgi:hypothetical protein